MLPHRSLVLGGFYGEGGVTLGRLCGKRQVVFSHCFGGIKDTNPGARHMAVALSS